MIAKYAKFDTLMIILWSILGIFNGKWTKYGCISTNISSGDLIFGLDIGKVI